MLIMGQCLTSFGGEKQTYTQAMIVVNRHTKETGLLFSSYEITDIIGCNCLAKWEQKKKIFFLCLPSFQFSLLPSPYRSFTSLHAFPTIHLARSLMICFHSAFSLSFLFFYFFCLSVPHSPWLFPTSAAFSSECCKGPAIINLSLYCSRGKRGDGKRGREKESKGKEVRDGREKKGWRDV